nr:hypothetical protein CFP56_03828 [Quercus suber]
MLTLRVIAAQARPRAMSCTSEVLHSHLTHPRRSVTSAARNQNKAQEQGPDVILADVDEEVGPSPCACNTLKINIRPVHPQQSCPPIVLLQPSARITQ